MERAIFYGISKYKNKSLCSKTIDKIKQIHRVEKFVYTWLKTGWQPNFYIFEK